MIVEIQLNSEREREDILNAHSIEVEAIQRQAEEQQHIIEELSEKISFASSESSGLADVVYQQQEEIEGFKMRAEALNEEL